MSCVPFLFLPFFFFPFLFLLFPFLFPRPLSFSFFFLDLDLLNLYYRVVSPYFLLVSPYFLLGDRAGLPFLIGAAAIDIAEGSAMTGAGPEVSFVPVHHGT